MLKIEQYYLTCKKEYEYWKDDPNTEYNCGYCGILICINDKHNYLYCSKECEELDLKKQMESTLAA